MTDFLTAPDASQARSQTGIKESRPLVAMLWQESLGAGFANAVALAANAIAGVYVARRLAPSDYGHLAYFYSVLAIILLVGSLGLSTRAVMAAAESTHTLSEDKASPDLGSLIAMRLLSLGPLLAIAGIGIIIGNEGVALATVVGGAALLGGFLQGVLQGIGRILRATYIQSLQAVAYLSLLLMGWVANLPRVYEAVVFSYLLVLILTVGAILQLRPFALRSIRLRLAHVRSLVSSLLSIYVLTLLIAPVASLGVLMLGNSGHLIEAANFGIAMGLMSFVTTICSAMITTVYYPRLCRLLASKDKSGTTVVFSLFYRGFAAAGIAVAAIVTTNPDTIIRTIYTEKYAGAAPIIPILGWMNLLFILEQFMAWTLVANGRYARTLFPAAVQILILVTAGYTITTQSPQSLVLLALAHTGAVVLGSLLMYREVYTHGWYEVPVGRVVVGAGLALAVAFLSTTAIHTSGGWRSLVAVMVGLVASGLAAMAILMPGEVYRLLRGRLAETAR